LVLGFYSFFASSETGARLNLAALSAFYVTLLLSFTTQSVRFRARFFENEQFKNQPASCSAI